MTGGTAVGSAGQRGTPVVWDPSEGMTRAEGSAIRENNEEGPAVRSLLSLILASLIEPFDVLLTFGAAFLQPHPVRRNL